MKKTLATAGLVLLLAACQTSNADKGWQAYQAGDYATARTYLEPAAAEGNASAANNLGMLHRDGLGGLQSDYAKALTYFEAAAEKDFSFAYNNIALMSELGWGGPVDMDKAFMYYEKAVATAARDGNFYAYDNLGRMYENGWGTAKDMDKAIELYKQSAAMGYETAQKNLMRLGVN